MFQKRLNFIIKMQKERPGSYPSFPLDLKEKKSQQACRDLALRGVEEMFEALQHLKNWKPHRITNIPEEVDRDAFLEEIVDALNYFFSLLIVVGIDEDELHKAYLRKDEIIRERLLSGY
jgi:NTP pyrophosphatase (non-canonical NTP hydrolase)